MKTFGEWLEQRVDEGSLGLRRRERVAAGMAKRQARIDAAFPNSSDSAGHVAQNKLAADVEDAAGRHHAAGARMMQRSNQRLQAMTMGDKSARQMMAGKGGMAAVKANMDRSDDSQRALANYNRPEILAQRGQPNWAADGNSFDQMRQSPLAQSAQRGLEAKRQAEIDRIEWEKQKAQMGSRPPRMTIARDEAV
jgi:hypothetical protein